MNIKPGVYLNGTHVDDLTKEDVIKIAMKALSRLAQLREALLTLKNAELDEDE